MAKESMKAREVKRQKLVNRYAEKRAALKAAGDQEGLSKLPRNSNPIRLHNRCMITGRPKGYMRQPYPVPRDGFQRAHPRSEEGFLVGALPPAGFRNAEPSPEEWPGVPGALGRRDGSGPKWRIYAFFTLGNSELCR